jgi:hypothetical protein
MSYTKICFYNRWHNGDVFSGKGYMQDLIRQLPEFTFCHSQMNRAKTMRDLKVTHIPIEQVPVTDGHKVTGGGDTIYINTWIGAYKGQHPFVMLAGEEHGNYPSLWRMWMYIYEQLEWYLDRKLEKTENVVAYIPSTDWTQYDIAPASNWLEGKSRIALICNGLAQSGQSGIQDMGDIIKNLSQIHPDVSFVCTSRIDTTWFPYKDNIFFTDDIFAGVADGDLNEIAFLSTKAELIVGKNSGPFMYAHVKENIWNPNVAFLSLSHRPSDSYVCHLVGFPCRYFHYSGESPFRLTFHLNDILNGKGNPHNAQMQILGD